jgi:hypothetical protein
VLARVLGLEAQVALFPPEQVEERVVDLLLDEVLEHLAVEVALVDEDLAEAPPAFSFFWIFCRPSAWRSCFSEMTPAFTRRLPRDSRL